MWNETSSSPEIVPQLLGDLGEDGMVGAEHGPEVPDALLPALQAFLVEIVAEQVHAVGAGQVEERVPVEVRHGHAGRGAQEGAGREPLADDTAVLERDAIRVGELQVRDAVADPLGQAPRLGETLAIELRQPLEAGPAAGNGVIRRAVRSEEARSRRSRRTG